MRVQLFDLTAQTPVPLQEFARSKNVTVRTVKRWASKGKITLIKKDGDNFVNVVTCGKPLDENTASSPPSILLEIPIPRAKRNLSDEGHQPLIQS